ncbi:MAG: hypothetical protein ABW007_19355 [Chitinophagaceae bacterium]
MAGNQITGFSLLDNPTPDDVLHINSAGIDYQVKVSVLQALTLAVTTKASQNTTLSLLDKARQLAFTYVGRKTCVIPDDLPVGYSVLLVNANGGGPLVVYPSAAAKIKGTGVPIIIPEQGDVATITCIAANRYSVSGKYERQYIEFTAYKNAGNIAFTIQAGEAFKIEWWDGTVDSYNTSAATAVSKYSPDAEIKRVRVFATVANGPTKITGPNNGITNVKAENLSTLTELSLSNNGITNFDSRGLDELTKLVLTANPITRVYFPNLSKLSELNLESTDIHTIVPDGMISLYTLYVGDSNLLTFSGSGFTRLNSLYIQNCPGLASFNGVGMPSLVRLTMNGCTGITYLDCKGLHSLARLFASGMGSLEEFNGNDLRQITHLDLSSATFLQKLTNFPTVETGPESVIKLGDTDLSSAQITAMYNAVGSPVGLTKNINVVGATGAGASTTPATAKGWTVTNA